jgi:hypothetical protein
MGMFLSSQNTSYYGKLQELLYFLETLQLRLFLPEAYLPGLDNNNNKGEQSIKYQASIIAGKSS